MTAENIAMIGWTIAFVVFLAVEVITIQLVSIWFAIGSLGAIAAAVCHGSFLVQCMVFLLVSLVFLILLRPIVSRYTKKHFIPTNADSLVGRQAKVTGRIHNEEGFGSAIVAGKEWSAISENPNVIIEEGEFVKITAISGVKLIVRKEG